MKRPLFYDTFFKELPAEIQSKKFEAQRMKHILTYPDTLSVHLKKINEKMMKMRGS